MPHPAHDHPEYSSPPRSTPVPPAPVPCKPSIPATPPAKRSAPPAHSPSSTQSCAAECNTHTHLSKKPAASPTEPTYAQAPTRYSGSAPAPSSSPNPPAPTAHTSISLHSYLKASAGNTFAALPL